MSMMQERDYLVKQWLKVSESLKTDLGEDIFASWIKPIAPVKVENHTIFFTVPTSFLGTWVSQHYSDTLIKHWSAIVPDIKDIEFVSDHTQSSIEITKNEESNVKEVRQNLDFLDQRFTFSNFVVGKTNELAYAAALRVSESLTPPFNPLFLYGGVGLGKTHLMHAIAWNLSKTTRKVLYTSAEKFMYEFIQSMRFKNTSDFKEKFRSVDVLMIDDVQFIGGKDTTQEEFFHTFNDLVNKKRQVIVSADKSPSDLEKVEERLKSRLGWGLVADIHPSTYELRLSILQAKADAMQLRLSQDVLELLAAKITSNIRELEGALNRINAQARLRNKNLDIDSVQILLKDLLKGVDKQITIEDIQRKVCEHFNLRISDLLSDKRVKNLVVPRQIAVYLSKALTSKSLPDIGRKFGGRDHTTVLHAIRKIEDLLSKDPDLEKDVTMIRRTIDSYQ